MATQVIMPQGGQDINEGTVVKWLKSETDTIKKGDVLCEVETEKIVFEVEAPADGVLLKIVVPEGGLAPIFSTIAIIGEPGETLDFEISSAETQPEQQAQNIPVHQGQSIEQRHSPSGKKKVSGRAKKLAAQEGIDLDAVQGTGPNGRIVEKDVRAKMLEQASASKPSPSVTPVQKDRGRSVPLSKMRKIIGRRMQQSKQTIPHFYVTVSVMMDEAIQLRQTLNQVAEPKISMNDLIIKGSALALEEFVQVNAMIQDEDLVFLDEVNIGIAVGLDEGLVVPVLPRVETLSLKDIARQSKELINRVQEGKQPNLEPGSFTVSNMGMLNVENFTAIINPPESAILAVGSTEKKVVVSSSNDLCIRNMMKMTLSVDHRLVDGVLASKFLNKIKYHLQNPQTLLAQ